MALTQINESLVAGPYIKESATQLTTLTFSAGDATNNNKVVMGKRRVLIIMRNDNVAAQNVTIKSSTDPYGRTADITNFSIPAGGYVSRIFEPPGWESTLGGKDLEIQPASTDIKIIAIQL